MTPDPETAAYLRDQRWFAGKGRRFEVAEVSTALEPAGLRIDLVRVEYAEGSPASEIYQLPVVLAKTPVAGLEHALIRHEGDVLVYDAVHDETGRRALLAAIDGAPDLGADVGTRLMTAEQSNSSIVYGDVAILKIFRRLTPGRNPDIEIHAALTAAGDVHVAGLFGSLAVAEYDLGMLQQFLHGATDGWDLALAAVASGADFTEEARRLGVALASVHVALAGAFGTGALDTAELAGAMTERLRGYTEIVPALSDHAARLSAIFDDVARGGSATAHRVHGDLHLGQTLRSDGSWKIVDFEGEPAKPLAERRRPDSPWRDVAGMVRSFGYAAAAGEGSGDPHWERACVTAFLEGYRDERGAPITEEEQLLLDAYIADKAVYEAAYEARNRPTWLPIPLAALDELTEGTRR